MKDSVKKPLNKALPMKVGAAAKVAFRSTVTLPKVWGTGGTWRIPGVEVELPEPEVEPAVAVVKDSVERMVRERRGNRRRGPKKEVKEDDLETT